MTILFILNGIFISVRRSKNLKEGILYSSLQRVEATLLFSFILFTNNSAEPEPKEMQFKCLLTQFLLAFFKNKKQKAEHK